MPRCPKPVVWGWLVALSMSIGRFAGLLSDFRSRRPQRPGGRPGIGSWGPQGWLIAAHDRITARTRHRRIASGASSTSAFYAVGGPARIGYLLGIHPSTV